jgi:hypothetical protein
MDSRANHTWIIHNCDKRQKLAEGVVNQKCERKEIISSNLAEEILCVNVSLSHTDYLLLMFYQLDTGSFFPFCSCTLSCETALHLFIYSDQISLSSAYVK